MGLFDSNKLESILLLNGRPLDFILNFFLKK